ncbi:MAG TPA: SDR family NAD(P)-dependent oxidoreductase [Oscillospiraceae bacterium]|nr:SDR family NAD(P)-dependent oxidoreductase [Oscillospiraceae bacterium]
MKEFRDKIALITGAGNGFGQEFAKEATRRGMKLMLADIDEADVRRTQAWVRENGGTAEIVVADVSLEEDVEKMVNETLRVYGRIDLLINNAGIAIGGEVTELPSRDWEWIIHTNDLSQVYSMKRVIPIMERQGTPCHILNVASLAGLLTMGNMPAYFATKHFAVALSESVYYDLQTHKDKIKMSVFCPSFVQTDLHHYERHRPARYRAPEDPYYTSEPYYREQKVAEKVITTGTPLGPVGPFVFDALERETFYIELHPNTKIMIKHRARDILKERVPDAAFITDVRDLVEGRFSVKKLIHVLRTL